MSSSATVPIQAPPDPHLPPLYITTSMSSAASSPSHGPSHQTFHPPEASTPRAAEYGTSTPVSPTFHPLKASTSRAAEYGTSTPMSPTFHPPKASTSRAAEYGSSTPVSPLNTPRASNAQWFSTGSSSSSTHINGSPRASDSQNQRIPLQSLLRMLSGRTTSDTQSEAGTSREAEDHNQQKFVCIKVNKEGNASNTAPKLLTGDIVKNVSLEGKKKATITLSSDRGKQALLDGLRQYSCPGQKLIITVLRQGRGEPFTTEAKLVNKNLKTTSNPIILQDRQDQSHEFTFEDYKEWMKAQVEQLEGMKVKAATVDISELLQATPNDSHIGSCYSMVVVPQWNTKFSRFNNVDETVSQARSWFNASINSGVPLLFINIQTEPFVLDLESSSYGGLSSISSTGTYGLQPSRGAASLDVVRAIRMWFRFEFPEFEIELQANQAEEFLGVGIGGTTEGFCHVTHVGPDTAASRKHLHTKLEVADRLEKKLVVTQVGNEKVLPWFISDRKIRCFNVQSILDILSAYRRACRPISLHILDM